MISVSQASFIVAHSRGGDCGWKSCSRILLGLHPPRKSSFASIRTTSYITDAYISSFWHHQLMKRQEEFYDRPTADLTTVQIREKLVKLAGEVPSIGQDKLPAILDLITYKSTPNGGVAVTDDVKWFGKPITSLAFFNGFSPSRELR